MMEAQLNIKNLYKHFDGIVAVDHVDLSVSSGSITGIFGDNGTGKTTLFNLISGFEKPDSGMVFFEGKDISHYSVLRRARMGLGRLFQSPRIFGDLTVIDNLIAAGKNIEGNHLHNYLIKQKVVKENQRIIRERAINVLEQFHLTEKLMLKAYELSVGEKRLLSLGSLLMNGAKLLLLDEPFAGINEVAAVQIAEKINQLKKSGITILMIEHDLARLNNIADTLYEMKQGKIDEVKRN